MKQEKLLKLLFALIKNSKRSDRDLAKILGFSQPTVTRGRKALEKEAIKQYTIIPKLPYLGFDIIALTFSRTKELVHPLGKRKEMGGETAERSFCKHRSRDGFRRNYGFSAQELCGFRQILSRV